MKPNFNQDDKKFIQSLKKIVNKSGYMAIHYPDEKSFQIMEKTNKVKDCTQDMIEALEQDFFQGTHTYHYQLYDPNHKYIQPIMDKLIQLENNPMSNALRLFMLDVLGRPFVIFYSLLKMASKNKDKTLILEILKKPIEYGKVDSYLHKKFYQITHFYRNIQAENNISKDIAMQSFITHIKASNIDIDSTLLIKTFIELFTSSSLDFLFKELNLSPPSICCDVEKVIYSTFNLNKSAMMIAQIEKDHVEQIVNVVAKLEISFPSFFVLNETQGYLEIIVRSENKNQLRQDKEQVMALFEHLLSNHYDFHLDKALDYKQLFNVVQSIKEKSHLDRMMIDEPKLSAQKHLKI